MPEKERWPAGPGSSSLDRMMSNVSTRSASSDSSYDFLSAEEKACLRFLEETIGSLDAEADSGVSTDESAQAPAPQGSPALPAPQPVPQGRPVEPALQRRPPSRALTPPSPLRPPAPQGLGLWSGSHSLPRNIHIGRNQRPGPGTTQTPALRPSEGVVPAPGEEQGHRPREASDTDVVPPPEAFRDSRPAAPREQSHSPRPPAAPGSPERGAPGPEAMSQAAKEQGQPALPGAQSSRDPRGAPVPAGAHPEAQQGPATAPKPRKLPPNIVLKSSRGSLRAEPQHLLSRPAEAPGDAEQRRARREALEKLGLPQDQEDPSAHPSRPQPGGSLELREPPAPARRPPLGSAQGPALGPGQTPGPEPAPGRATPAPGLTLLREGAPGLRQASVKASTLERSGVGLGSALLAEGVRPGQASSSPGKGAFLDKLSPQVLRNSRPRPASLGTGRDFEGIQMGRLADLEQEQSAPRAPRHGQSHKLPRPLCVNVKIAPRGVPAEHRREALRKLGLLKE